MMIANMASGQMSINLGAKGPNTTQVTACATGTHSIGDSYRLIQRGDADVMICGGAEATIRPTGMAGFCAMRAMSTRNDEPEKPVGHSIPAATVLLWVKARACL